MTVNGTRTPPNPGLTYPASSAAWAVVSTPVTLASGTNTIVVDTSYQSFDWLEIR